MPPVTFINYNANHRRNSFRDVRSINAHVATRAAKRRVYEAEPWLLISPLDSQIGGYRTDPFDMLPVHATRDVVRAFDYCEQLDCVVPSFHVSSGADYIAKIPRYTFQSHYEWEA